jgi:acylphosphatase
MLSMKRIIWSSVIMSSEPGAGKNEAYRINVSGRVQGVGFRYSTLQKASRLKLTGWVRNERDGSVEIHCEGSPEGTAALIEWLEEGGPSYSQICYIKTIPVEAQGFFKRFSVEY